MEILPLFSQPVYIDVVNLDPDVLTRAEKTPMQDMSLDGAYKKNGFMSQDTQWLSNHLDVKDIVDQHMDIYVHEALTISRKHRLQHQSSWINYHGIGDSAAEHTHVNSMFSGCLYIKVPPNCGEFRLRMPTMFPTYLTSTVQPDIMESNYLNQREFPIEPCEGTIIIFPSHLPHYVSPSDTEEDRYSCAFNYFLKGPFGYEDTALTL
tara:strand:- start:221 stop:841 length:621 start_codon:yes stop_codon:yes gene_type:complete